MRCRDCAYMRTFSEEGATGALKRMYDVCTRRHRCLPDNKQYVVNRDYWHECPRFLSRKKTRGYLHGRIRAERFTDSRYELMSYSTDIRKILSNNSVKEIEEKEDAEWRETIKEAIGAWL